MESRSIFPASGKYRLATGLAASLCVMAILILAGCLAKDKDGKELRSGSMTPPWDSAHFTPKSLEGYVYSGPESTFAVFRKIARIDSLCGSHTEWKADPDAIDTLRISQLFDTGFLFPENPEASMPYAFDDSFRDDTLYRKAYGNGLYTQDHPCATTTILSGEFLHPARWLRAGLSKNDVIHAMGAPLHNQPGVLRYIARHRVLEAPAQPQDSAIKTTGNGTFDVFEGANLYFQGDSLFAAMLQKSQPCH